MNPPDHRDCPTIGSHRKDGKPRRKNQHPIPCWKCGQPIPVGGAYVERSRGAYVGIPVTGMDLYDWTRR